MDAEQHAQTAREFLENSEREFEKGDVLQGSEKLWGAATHAVRAVIRSNGWSNGKYADLRRAVERLVSDRNDPQIRQGFDTARDAHSNFYHGFMEDDDIERARLVVRDFVERVLLTNPPRASEDLSPPSIGE